MEERYSRLFTLPHNLYAEGAPLLIAAGALLKENMTGDMMAQLKFRSMDSRTIRAITVRFKLFDPAGNSVGAPVYYQYRDLDFTQKTEEYGSRIPVWLPDQSVRSYRVAVTEVVFADQSVWSGENAVWEPLPPPRALNAALGSDELAKQHRLKYGQGHRYCLTEVKDLWYCTCGTLNRLGDLRCPACHTYYHVLKSIDLHALQKEMMIRKEQERAAEETRRREAELLRKEQEKLAQEMEKKRRKVLRIVKIVSIALAVLLVGWWLLDWITSGIRMEQLEAQTNENAYQAALDAYESGDYYEANRQFRLLGDYKDSQAWEEKAEAALLQADYQAAVDLLKAGEYEQAYNRFRALADEMDCSEYLDRFENRSVVVSGKTEWITEEYIYDAFGRIVSRKRAYRGSGSTELTEYVYNDAGELTDVTVTNHYMNGNRMDQLTTTITFTDHGTYSYYTQEFAENLIKLERFYTYDEHGNVLTAKAVFAEDNPVLKKKKGDIRYEREYHYTYDENGRLIQWYYTEGLNASKLDHQQWHYNENGNLEKITWIDYDNTKVFEHETILVYKGE